MSLRTGVCRSLSTKPPWPKKFSSNLQICPERLDANCCDWKRPPAVTQGPLPNVAEYLQRLPPPRRVLIEETAVCVRLGARPPVSIPESGNGRERFERALRIGLGGLSPPDRAAMGGSRPSVMDLVIPGPRI